jgi:alpha-beta hydrolase superfamily lysophospholipase
VNQTRTCSTGPVQDTDDDRIHRRLLRAMPPERLLHHGMDWTDVVALDRALVQGEPWVTTLCRLAEAHIERAAVARGAGHGETAATWHLHASACLRFAYSAIDLDTAWKRRLHRMSIDQFRAAGRLHAPPVQEFDLGWQGHGWLMSASAAAPVGRCVVLIGGIDGWAEKQEMPARWLLARGVDAVLLDLPGQGQPRLVHASYFESDDAQMAALATVIAQLRDRGYRSVGVWGNSAGAYWAVLSGALLRGVDAVCGVSGSPRPGQFVQRYPGALARFQSMFGYDDQIPAAWRAQQWCWPDGARLTVPAIVLHGSADALYPVNMGRKLAAMAPPHLCHFETVEGGDHGLNNRNTLKCSMVADWFADQFSMS